MTKGQSAAANFIRSKVTANESFEWKEISAHVRSTGARVKNWLTIRSVLQYFINHGLVGRDASNIHIERYLIFTPEHPAP